MLTIFKYFSRLWSGHFCWVKYHQADLQTHYQQQRDSESRFYALSSQEKPFFPQPNVITRVFYGKTWGGGVAFLKTTVSALGLHQKSSAAKQREWASIFLFRESKWAILQS